VTQISRHGKRRGQASDVLDDPELREIQYLEGDLQEMLASYE
jgi:hypothetical protein